MFNFASNRNVFFPKMILQIGFFLLKTIEKIEIGTVTYCLLGHQKDTKKVSLKKTEITLEEKVNALKLFTSNLKEIVFVHHC